jgi:hypothetical protein
VVVPSEADGQYSFRDLVALRVVVSLLEAGLPMVRVRAALDVLRDAGEGSGDGAGEIAGLRLVTDGVSVFACYDDGQILDALRRGQLALFVAVDRFAADLDADVHAFTTERDTFLAHLRDGCEIAAGSDADDDRDQRVLVSAPVIPGVGVTR